LCRRDKGKTPQERAGGRPDSGRSNRPYSGPRSLEGRFRRRSLPRPPASPRPHIGSPPAPRSPAVRAAARRSRPDNRAAPHGLFPPLTRPVGIAGRRPDGPRNMSISKQLSRKPGRPRRRDDGSLPGHVAKAGWRMHKAASAAPCGRVSRGHVVNFVRHIPTGIAPARTRRRALRR
jgi:hypothetical protein